MGSVHKDNLKRLTGVRDTLAKDPLDIIMVRDLRSDTNTVIITPDLVNGGISLDASGVGGGGNGNVTGATGVPIASASGSSTYYVQASQHLLAIYDATAVNVVLEQNPDNGRTVVIKDASISNPDRNTYPITILPSGSNTIDGESQLQIINTRQSFKLTYNNTDWLIV